MSEHTTTDQTPTHRRRLSCTTGCRLADTRGACSAADGCTLDAAEPTTRPAEHPEPHLRWTPAEVAAFPVGTAVTLSTGITARCVAVGGTGTGWIVFEDDRPGLRVSTIDADRVTGVSLPGDRTPPRHAPDAATRADDGPGYRAAHARATERGERLLADTGHPASPSCSPRSCGQQARERDDAPEVDEPADEPERALTAVAKDYLARMSLMGTLTFDALADLWAEVKREHAEAPADEPDEAPEDEPEDPLDVPDPSTVARLLRQGTIHHVSTGPTLAEHLARAFDGTLTGPQHIVVTTAGQGHYLTADGPVPMKCATASAAPAPQLDAATADDAPQDEPAGHPLENRSVDTLDRRSPFPPTDIVMHTTTAHRLLAACADTPAVHADNRDRSPFSRVTPDSVRAAVAPEEPDPANGPCLIERLFVTRPHPTNRFATRIVYPAGEAPIGPFPTYDAANAYADRVTAAVDGATSTGWDIADLTEPVPSSDVSALADAPDDLDYAAYARDLAFALSGMLNGDYARKVDPTARAEALTALNRWCDATADPAAEPIANHAASTPLETPTDPQLEHGKPLVGRCANTFHAFRSGHVPPHPRILTCAEWEPVQP